MYREYFPKQSTPKGAPNGQQLHEQAMKARTDSVGGMDGVAPAELRTLPRMAWDIRARHLQNAYRNRRSPEAYYHVSSPIIPKQDKMDDSSGKTYPRPTDFRLITLMSAIYRVESGAQYKRHVQWLLEWIHPALYGGLPGHESAEVSWDAQSDIEEALAHKKDLTICLMDYWKFFDAMEPDFVKEFLLACGLDEDYVHMTHEMYKNMNRYIKLGRSYGDPIQGANGSGQGDTYSILVALALVAVQFNYIQSKFPTLRMGSCVDDRNIRGEFQQVLQAYQEMAKYDALAGHFNNVKKMALSSTCPKVRKKIAVTNIGSQEEPVFPRLFTVERLVGDFLNVTKRAATAEADKKVEYSIKAAVRTAICPTEQALKAKAVATLVIPRMLQGTQWNMPSARTTKRWRYHILTAI